MRLPSPRRWNAWLLVAAALAFPWSAWAQADDLELDPRRQKFAPDERGWFPFAPKTDSFNADNAIDCRALNESFAGEHGFIAVKDGAFVYGKTGEAVRFWAVNGPPPNLDGDALRQTARRLAKYGVNMVRIHGGYFDEKGDVNPRFVRRTLDVVAAMKAEGIYTHLSTYFPLWLSPKPGTPWLAGYDGKTHPFAALFFNPDFQAQYRRWWTALLTTPDPSTGKTLLEDPAVAGLEMQNEDSFFFWTFAIEKIPDAEARLLEKAFGAWLTRKYGTIDAAVAQWNGVKAPRDAPAEGRLSFRPLWNIFNEKTARDRDTAQFLFETQKQFYADTRDFLRKLGFKGVITASNWSTASPEVFGPLEKLSYEAGDFIDRHGYFGCALRGEAAEWSMRDGQTYSDRSALRFDAEDPGKPKQFVHPAMDPHYDGLPSMISETTWNRPNRYRSEAPLYFAAYGALQHTDAIVHFALDSGFWSVKPGYFMQPWTLMSPAMMGQFPAAARIFRRGLVTTGAVVADINLNRDDLFQLKGTPLPQDAALDELRLKDAPAGGAEVKPTQRLDPLMHYAGRVDVHITTQPGAVKVSDLKPFIDHEGRTVTSSTGELKLDYGRGVLLLNAARAQGLSGALKAAGVTQTKDLTISSELELGHVVVISLDDQPLSNSRRMLLQVMSEEKATGFATESTARNVQHILSIGTNPWLVKKISGKVSFKRADAAELKVTALDFNGDPVAGGGAGNANEISLQATVIYYLITR